MMELRSLRHVVVLARRLSYTRASEELGMSQSALSRSIQVLEDELGIRLFDRDRGKVQLTYHARAFVKHAAALISDADALRDSVRRTAKAEEGEVHFGIESLPARVMLPDVLAESIISSPNLKVRVQVNSIDSLWDELISRKIEFFISAQVEIPEGFPVMGCRFGAFPLSFLVRPGHPALTPGSSSGPFPVLLAGDAGQLQFVPPSLKELTRGPQHIIDDYEMLIKITERSDSILISSTLAAIEEIKSGRICDIPFHDNRSIDISIYQMRRRYISPGAVKIQNSFKRHMILLEDSFANR